MAAMHRRQGKILRAIPALLAALGAAATLGALPATTPTAQARALHRGPVHVVAPLYTYSSIVVDARTGRMLKGDNQDALHHPASLAKLMTLYLAFEALRDRRITLDDPVPVSAHAASMVPTKLGLVPGTHITVREAILGMVTLSANDAAAALGEKLGGTEPHFAQMMTLRARALGMSRTTFRNASGLPDPNMWTTAHDMAILARHLLVDFRDDYHYFSTPSFVFHGRTIYNHDTMLKSYPGVDGMKTGYIETAGHNLVTSVKHGDERLIGVVLGANTNWQRDQRMTALLNVGFADLNGPAQMPNELASAHTMPAIFSTAHAATLRRVSTNDQATSFDAVQREIASARAERGAPHAAGGQWMVQAGVYPTHPGAAHAAAEAHAAAHGGSAQITPYRIHGHANYRARVLGLSEAQAKSACLTLHRQHTPCLVMAPRQQDVASR